ncbi:RNA dependent RNA polymerase-domain-containing protein [Sphaerosporella brunnea]|uniref:RNA dependent RNA polymerase-domain-containing protein n=1 Tax=Sphaerosporella brunnea TaxID=1250544 RepID=A0A5J5F7B8_9PEZI|nr:RNA dependent RNA polymerase-domain-containing protein [Sphaerosporella brunnea]
MPMLLSLPNSPPQVARRKVEPRVKTRRPSEPGRNRWEEETSNTLAGPPGIRLPERRPVHPSAQPQGLQIRPCDPSPSPSVRVDEPAQKLITRHTAVDSFPEKAQTEEKVHGVLAAHVHPCNQPFLRNEEWRKQPDVTVRFGPKLSPSISVKDIFLRIRDFGTVEMIDLLIDDDGRKIGKALVRFSNVRTPFWEAGWINFGSGTVGMKLERYKGASTVPSPSNPSKLYPAKLRFEVESLEFGFMLQAEEFMSMHKTRPGNKITWEVNLLKKRIEMMFHLFFDENDPAVKRVGPPQSDPRIYKVEIPFTQLQEILVPADEAKDGHKRTFVLPLPDPPRVSRELTNWTKSMEEPAMTRWTIHDVYMRQTDIELDMRIRGDRPVSLRHAQPVIDIGRWTTYRLCFDLKDSKCMEKFQTMLDAFKDFNVRSKPLQKFQVECDQSKLNPIWSYLDREQAQGASSAELLSSPFLTFPVRYQLEVCISHGHLNEYNLTHEFVDMLAKLSERDAVALLEAVHENKARFFQPMDILKIPRNKRIDSARPIPAACVQMRRATVTPTGILFHTPSVEISNRVIRHYDRYADRFIRVTFTDEKSSGRIRFTDKDNANELFGRVYRALNRGIVMGDRHYQFLAFGNSQLREHSAYFFAGAHDLSVNDIRTWMGEFSDIRVIAKHASRLGQCFSTTKAFKSCDVTLRRIPDVDRNGYKFSDGVGTMSPVVAHLLTEEFLGSRRSLPNYQASCFQFRLGGHKGVLALDPTTINLEVHLRPSQEKFWCPHKTLEIIRCSQFAAASLNRQLIQVMSNLGVSDLFFRNRLNQILADYSTAVTSPNKALELLTKHIDPNFQTLAIANLIRFGFMASAEPFVMSLIHLWRAWTIKYLKEKAKITIDDGAFLLGVVDETATLRGYFEEVSEEDQLPQIFCQVTDISMNRTRVITGRCVVARNPSLHPGDVRIVEAVDVPALHHLVDVVVFPQTGDRDIPSMLSGGDLDGDDYVVIWDEELTAPGVITNEPPASYKPKDPIVLDRDVSIKDIQKFFVNYMKNDRLGSIANAHLAWADSHTLGVKSPICLQLAELHSDAVDYPKTGLKAQMSKAHRIRRWPHFFEKPVEEGVYISTKILGQLYDMVERVDFTPCYHLPPNEKIMTAFELSPGDLQEAMQLKNEYDAAVYRIMAQHDIKSEFEVWSTFVMHHSGSNDYKFHEEIGGIAETLKDRFCKYVIENCAEPRKTVLPRKVAAMYVVTQRAIEQAKSDILAEKERLAPRNKGKLSFEALTKEDLQKLPLMSFPWLFGEVLARLASGYKDVAHDYSGPGHCEVSFISRTDDEGDYEYVPIKEEDNALDDGQGDHVPIREEDNALDDGQGDHVPIREEENALDDGQGYHVPIREEENALDDGQGYHVPIREEENALDGGQGYHVPIKKPENALDDGQGYLYSLNDGQGCLYPLDDGQGLYPLDDGQGCLYPLDDGSLYPLDDGQDYLYPLSELGRIGLGRIEFAGIELGDIAVSDGTDGSFSEGSDTPSEADEIYPAKPSNEDSKGDRYF